MNKKNIGFSLIEILVASAVIITSTTIIVSILSSSFRGVSKVTISEEVRQNGNSALSRMARMIQFAESFEGASVQGSFFEFCPPEGKEYQFIKIRTSGQSRTLSCEGLSIKEASGVEASLIDSTRVNLIGGSCKFTCIQNSRTTPPVIGINFKLSQSASLSTDQAPPITFSTSVKMRNL